MTPIKNAVYEIEFDDGTEIWRFMARCICEQPQENGAFIFECDDDPGVELEVDPSDIMREVCTVTCA